MSARLATHEEPIPGYRLIERLGRGGFGEVWKAEAPGGLFKAIKFVYGDVEGAAEDGRPAEQELKALHRVKSIRHPFILSLERFDIIAGQLIIVMELADRNLWDRFREARNSGLPGIPREELLGYMDETAEALDLMNDQFQLQHLDIKPQNLFLVYNHIKVADFGLAKDFHGMRATVTGGVTPVYAAPETFDGWVSRFCDQYSLAIVFQELLTGQRPFTGTNTRQLLLQHLSGVPDLTALPPDDRPVVARALSKKPDERFPSVREFVRALHAAGSGTPLNGDVHPGPDAQTPGPGLHSTPGESLPRRVAVQTQMGGGPVLPVLPPLPPLSDPARAKPLTHLRAPVHQTALLSKLRVAPPERTGPGCLMPALVIGVGRTGLQVIRQFRAAVAERFGPTAVLPHLRCLFLDTDPETLESAVAGPQAISPREVIAMRLSRPGHYLRNESMPPADDWIDPALLHRIPRNLVTGGVRAFGRLAFCDHYRTIAMRLRAECNALVTEDALTEADRSVGLGLRTNVPRIFVAVSLAGGTGSGCFIDLGYLARSLLRQMGYPRPDVVGVLAAPAFDRTQPKGIVTGNTYAALTELAYFGRPDVRFEVQFDKSEGRVTDPDPPFTRCIVLNQPRTADPVARHAPALAGSWLARELLSPMGRVADDRRAVYAAARPPEGPSWQSFGLYRLAWPRGAILERAVLHFSRAMMQRWMSKESSHLREAVAGWLDEQWSVRQIDTEAVLGRLHDAVRARLAGDPEAVFDAFSAGLSSSGVLNSGSKLDALAACGILDKVLQLVGKPAHADGDDAPGALRELLQDTARLLIAENEAKLSEMAVYFIEQPSFRLAGSEEAIRQLTARLQQSLEAFENLQEETAEQARATYLKMLPMIGSLQGFSLGARKSTVTAEILDLLRTYPRHRYQTLVLESAVAVYRSLLANTPEYLREVNFCRLRLGEITEVILGPMSRPADDPAPGHPVLPPGCKTLTDAADRFVAGLPPEAVHDFEHVMQAQLRKQFRGLVKVCLDNNPPVGPLRDVIIGQVREFLGARLERANPAEMFFRNRPQTQAAQRDISQAFDESAPELGAGHERSEAEVCVLGAPEDEHGRRFRELAAVTLPDVDLVEVANPDDIVFYREIRHLAPGELPQLSPPAKDAYRKSTTEDVPTFHSRRDVPWSSVKF
jgi:hypothetical protein